MQTNVLLVVNNQRELDILSHSLQGEFNVLTARNVKETWYEVGRQPVQLIVCSTDLPVKSGWELCIQLKSIFDYSHIPVILISENSPEAKIKSLNSGADAIMAKPFSACYLKAQINNLISNRLKIAQHFAQFPVGFMGFAETACDDDFIKRLNHFLFHNVRKSNFQVDLLAKHMNMSRPTLYRKLRNITDLTPNKLINLARLKQAAELLSLGNYKIFEVAQMVGFHSQSSFGKAFLKQYNVTPAEYQRLKKSDSYPVTEDPLRP